MSKPMSAGICTYRRFPSLIHLFSSPHSVHINPRTLFFVLHTALSCTEAVKARVTRDTFVASVRDRTAPNEDDDARNIYPGSSIDCTTAVKDFISVYNPFCISYMPASWSFIPISAWYSFLQRRVESLRKEIREFGGATADGQKGRFQVPRASRALTWAWAATAHLLS